MSKLLSTAAGRGLPDRDRDSHLTMPSVIRVLRDVLIHQSVAFDPQDEGMGICFRKGWIHRDMDSGEGNYCTFPTPLHAMFVEFIFGTSTAPSFPTSYKDPLELWQHILTKYSKRRLGQRACQGAKRGASGMLRPKECVFTDEFYYRYNELLDFAGEIVGQWGCGRGEIDYFVREPRWGFEFLTAWRSTFRVSTPTGRTIEISKLVRWPTGWWLTAELPRRRNRYFSPLTFHLSALLLVLLTPFCRPQ